MPPNMRVRMRFPMIWLAFRRRFGSKIDEKWTLDLEGLAKRKTLQNIGRGSKNQGSSFQIIMKNRFKNASEGDSEKIGPKIRQNTIFGALGARFGSRIRWILRSFSKLVLRRHATCPEIGQSRRDLEVCDCLPGLSKD